MTHEDMMLLTADDFIAAFGEEETLQIAGTGPRENREVDVVRMGEALGYAASIVTGYVRDRWPEAAGNGTPMLKAIAMDIARWRLRGRGGQQTSMNETVKERYDEAMGRLKDIASGRLTLDLPSGSDGDGLTAAADELRVISAVPDARARPLIEGFRHDI